MSFFTPYVSFPGTAAEAFTYYADVFGGELELSRYGEFPTDGFPFEPPADAVAHAQLRGGLVTLAGGDSMGEGCGEGEVEGLSSATYSFLLALDAVEDAQQLIERLVSTGGEPVMPFDLAPWGDHYGQVRDRYGVLWAVMVPGEGRGDE